MSDDIQSISVEVESIKVDSGRYAGSFGIRTEPSGSRRNFAILSTCKVTVEGQPANLGEVVIYVKTSRKVLADLVIDTYRYDHVDSVDFREAP